MVRESILIGEAMYASTIAQTILSAMITNGLISAQEAGAMVDAALLQFEELQGGRVDVQAEAITHCRKRLEGFLTIIEKCSEIQR